jgi:hypothetical protein
VQLQRQARGDRNPDPGCVWAVKSPPKAATRSRMPMIPYPAGDRPNPGPGQAVVPHPEGERGGLDVHRDVEPSCVGVFDHVGDRFTVHSLSPSQRQVITALCRPYTSGSPYATPATNQQLAEEIFLSVDSVKKSPAHPVRKVRRRGSSAEPETGAACRAGLQVRPGIRADRVTAHAGQPDVGCHLRACAVRLLGGVQDGQRSGVQIGDIRLSAIR